MPTVRLYFDSERVGQKLTRSVFRQASEVRNAARAAAFDASQEIKTRVDEDIKSAGNFGPRWTNAFQVNVGEGGGNIRISADIDTQSIPYFTVFEHGAVIHGRPLLWIPMSFATDAKGVLARNYAGGLFRVDRKDASKAPLLLSRTTREVKYFGKESVTLPKKFHIVQIIRDVARTLPELFRKNFNRWSK